MNCYLISIIFYSLSLKIAPSGYLDKNHNSCLFLNRSAKSVRAHSIQVKTVTKNKQKHIIEKIN
jgi:hypothetical protein